MDNNNNNGHLLTSLLSALQISQGRNEPSRLLGSSALCLAQLTNPLNVSLLTTQLLAAPALWNIDDPFKIVTLVLSAFQAAAAKKFEAIDQVLSIREWVDAVVIGADERVPRWKQLLACAGILCNFQLEDARLPFSTRAMLEMQVCELVNSCLESGTNGVETHATVFVLSRTFPFLSDEAKLNLDYDILLQRLLTSMYFSHEGYESGEFLRMIDADVKPIAGRLDWKSTSASYISLKTRASRPVLGNMGALARLAAFAVERTMYAESLVDAIEKLSMFSSMMSVHWRNCKLGTVEYKDEPAFFSESTAKTTTPFLWQVLKMALFSTVVVLQSMITKIMDTPPIARSPYGLLLPANILVTLRGLYFITLRMGPSAFSAYNFVYLASIDMLIQDHPSVERLVERLAPIKPGKLANNVMDRCSDLYFLNTMEYLTMACSPQFIDLCVIPSMTPYLAGTNKPEEKPLFEAAHSVMLAIIGTPSAAELSAKILPFYIEAVFQGFPKFLSSRQFRLAMSTIIKDTSPPSRLSALEPALPDVVVEILLSRIERASSSRSAADATFEDDSGSLYGSLSERDTCILALLESLPFMEGQVMARWLEPTARLVGQTRDVSSRSLLQTRFWEVISGEMDVERAQIAVSWWSEGGRDVTLGFDEGQESYVI